jgi:hypothetical protein
MLPTFRRALLPPSSCEVSMAFRNVGILPHLYMPSQLRRPGLETLCCVQSSEVIRTDKSRCVSLNNIYIWILFVTSIDGGAGTAQWFGAGLRAGWLGVRVPARAGNFFLHHRVQTGSGSQPAPYPIGARGSFPGGKAAGAWSWPLTSI